MSHRRNAARLVALIVSVATALAIAPASSPAAYIHPAVTASFGADGTSGSSFAGVNRLAFAQGSKRLYVLDGGAPKIYGFNTSTPGTYTPLTGNFPITVPGTGGDPDIAVDNSGGGSTGNLYYLSEGEGGFAYDAAGNALFTISRSNFGDPCGIAVDNEGGVLVSDYGAQKVYEFPETGGASSGFFSVFGQGSQCHIAADPGTGDVYVSTWNGATYRYTSSSNYTVKSLIDPGSARAIAVDAVTHRVYVVHSDRIDVYDPSGSRLEEFGVGTGNWIGAAVDGASGIVYLADQSTNQIKVLPGVVVPDVSISEQTGFATLHGHVDPAGGGDVTACKFEFSTSAEYTAPTTQEVPCEPTIPPSYSSPQDVSVDLTGKVSGEVLYHFRLKATNGSGTNTSADGTFTPHYVAGLHADAATEVDRKSAELNGSFLGANKDTHYYFKWGLTSTYGNTTPVEDAGATTGQTTVVPALLDNVLEPQTTYHYTIVATNAEGTSEANDATFETKPAVFGLSTDPATNIKTETADLNGSFTGDGFDTKYWFEYGSSSLYGNKSAEGEVTNPSGPTVLPAIGISELQPLHNYHYRVVVENSFGKTFGPDKTFTTFTAPVVISLSTSGVTGTEADLHAVIHPHGAEAEYHFEYGPTGSYGTSIPVPDGTIPAGSTPVPVDVHLTGLNGGVYHFRIVTKNVYGESQSKDQTFNFYPPVCPNGTVRQQSGSNTLPDCRAYELVTPEDQGITIIYPANAPFSATASSPSRISFNGSFGLIPGAGEAVNNISDSYVATRTATGWKTKYVGLPSSATSIPGSTPWHIPSGGYEPGKWNEDLLWNPSLSELVDWNDGYFKNGELFEETEHTASSNAPYVWDSTSGKQVDRWPTNVGAVPGGEHFKGTTNASADLSHFVFTSDVPFAAGGEPGDMYDNDTVTGSVQVISLKPDNTTHIAGTFPLDVSEDGSHVLMAVGTGKTPMPFQGPGELYLRVNDSVTYEIAPGKSVQYLTMTPDGKKLYFTTAESLTPEDSDTSLDLYMWDEESATPGHLVLISKGNEPTAGNTDACSASWTTKCGISPISFNSYTAAQGSRGGNIYSDNFVAAANGDIYYLSPEQLAGNNGVNGQENLYVYRNGKNQFVTALDPSGIACVSSLGLGGNSCSENAVARMEVTSDDSYMAFLTGSNVTGYDSTGHSEIYEYRPATREMTCESCLPSGEPPAHDVTASHNGKFLTEDGRTFFNADDSLVPQDTNQAGDVYEYVDGRPQLITSGTNVGNNSFGVSTIAALPGLVGVSADGTDVYFATYDVLVGQDRNGEALKIYDARSGGGFQFTPPVPPCVAADECHGPATEAPTEAANGTGAELGGTGNVKSGVGGKAGKKHKRPHHKRHHKKRTHLTKKRRGNG